MTWELQRRQRKFEFEMIHSLKLSAEEAGKGQTLMAAFDRLQHAVSEFLFPADVELARLEYVEIPVGRGELRLRAQSRRGFIGGHRIGLRAGRGQSGSRECSSSGASRNVNGSGGSRMQILGER